MSKKDNFSRMDSELLSSQERLRDESIRALKALWAQMVLEGRSINFVMQISDITRAYKQGIFPLSSQGLLYSHNEYSFQNILKKAGLPNDLDKKEASKIDYISIQSVEKLLAEYIKKSGGKKPTYEAFQEFVKNINPELQLPVNTDGFERSYYPETFRSISKAIHAKHELGEL